MRAQSGNLVSRGGSSRGLEMAATDAGAGGRAGRYGSGRRKSLLLLEDDEALRQMLMWELTELGYQVHPVGSCLEARTAMAARELEFALFDVGLPDGDGAALAAELMRIDPHPGIILCSGRPGNLDPAQVPGDLIACLTKPVCVHRLDLLYRGNA